MISSLVFLVAFPSTATRRAASAGGQPTELLRQFVGHGAEQIAQEFRPPLSLKGGRMLIWGSARDESGAAVHSCVRVGALLRGRLPSRWASTPRGMSGAWELPECPRRRTDAPSRRCFVLPAHLELGAERV